MTAVVSVISREDWGAAAPLRPFTAMSADPVGIVVHHSAGHDTSIDAVPLIQEWHQGRGWSDIGYHYLITGTGEICEGRPEQYGRAVVGAHDASSNWTRLGVCLLGTYSQVAPSAAMMAALVDLCPWLAVRHRMRPLHLTGHRDHKATACPGVQLYNQLPLVREMCRRQFCYRIEVADG